MLRKSSKAHTFSFRKVSVEKHGVNNHLRQKGKIAELALGYGGSVGALKAMGTHRKLRPEICGEYCTGNIKNILVNSMKTLRNCSIVAHVHDELIIECDPSVSLEAVCEQMGRVPKWADGLLLRADGYVCDFYQKD